MCREWMWRAVMFWLLALISRQYSLCSSIQAPPCLPCPSSCITCSTAIFCLSCTPSYFMSQGVCLACSANCVSCSSATSCTNCSNPYYLTPTLTCELCVVSNALSCSVGSVASACLPSYYLLNGNCLDCLLFCQQCSSSSTCTACVPGFYLNNTVLTCNPCTPNCIDCSASGCVRCVNGYSLGGGVCQAFACNVNNCLYCSNAGVCAVCTRLYYLSSNQCILGGSVACLTATGILPSECTACSSFALSLNSRCLSYPYVLSGSINYAQQYYYAYNDYTVLAAAAQLSSSTLTLLPNNEYALSVTSLTFAVPPYYRLTIAIKYAAGASISLQITAPGTTQSESAVLSSAGVAQINTTVVHSNGIKITGNVSWSVIEVWIRAYQCTKGCIQCLNQQLCEKCESPMYSLSYTCVRECLHYYHFPANQSCLISCPAGSYPASLNATYKVCLGCTSPCVTCADRTACLSCISPLFNYNYSCLAVCPDLYYGGGGVCVKCQSPCALCLSSTQCVSCALGYWDLSACVSVCRSGHFANLTAHACQPCSTNCLSCSNSSVSCTSCAVQLVLHNSVCLAVCPAGFYAVMGACAQCNPPCFACSNATVCLSCAFNYYYQGACVINCPQQYYADLTDSQCKACVSGCSACTSMTVCTNCRVGCLFLGGCLSTCPSTFYFPLTTTSCICAACTFPCGQCVSASSCLTCLQGYLLNSSCLSVCPTLMYANELMGVCSLCSVTFPSCSTCSPLSCTQCVSPSLLSNGACVTNCPTGAFKAQNQCLQCVYPCMECTSSLLCHKCRLPYSLMNGGCVIQCLTGYVSVLTIDSQSCLPCTPPCKACLLSPTTCTYCTNGYYRAISTCVTNCTALSPIATLFGDPSSSTCTACVSPCLTCLSRSVCLTCRSGSLTVQGSCAQCPLSTYSSSSICTACPVSCSRCFSPTFCTACATGYYLLLNSCIRDVSQCQTQGYYVIGNVCYPCAAPCLTCLSSSTQCVSCLPGYLFLLPSNCLSQCPAGQYSLNNTCAACATTCATCQGSLCYSCVPTAVLILSTLRCAATCPDGSFLLSTTCTPCLYPCRTCSKAVVCLSCVNGVLANGTCLSLCASHFYSSSSSVCAPCASPCSECSVSATNCTQCIPSYFLYSRTCLTACPLNHFPETQSQSCLKCPSTCVSCASYIDCRSCVSPLLLYLNPVLNIGECLSSCPPSSFAFNSNCAQCVTGCSQCVSATSCLICGSGKVQLQGNCVASCPQKMYSKQGVCTACSLPCAQCTDASTCLTCASNTDLFVASSCLNSALCPPDYYKIPGQMRCESSCPAMYYARTDGTCGLTCASNQFYGQDSKCYDECPDAYVANSTYYCVSCTQCQGLRFSLSYLIVQQSLYVTISFTQTPITLQTPLPVLNPPYPFTVMSTIQSRLLYPAFYPFTLMAGLQSTHQKRNLQTASASQIILLIHIQQSLHSQLLTINFQNSFATFVNPLQKNIETIIINGFDYYSLNTMEMAIWGYLSLFGAVCGLFSNPFFTDFAQILFLEGLIDYHYSPKFSAFLLNTSIAHFYDFISVQRLISQKTSHKISDPSLLKHTVFNYCIIFAFCILAFLIGIIFLALKKSLSYHKIHPEIELIASENTEPANQSLEQNVLQSKKHNCKMTIFHGLQKLFSNFSVLYVNRVVYFNYNILILFSLTQVLYFSTSSTFETVSSTMAVITLLLFTIFPLYLIRLKPKYTFLYARKLLICTAIIVSEKDSLYAIGVLSVCNIGAIVLILTHRLQKYRCETYFLAAAQIMQLCIQLAISVCVMFGQGINTSLKQAIMSGVLYSCIGLLIIYILHTFFEVALKILHHCTGKDYKEHWILNETKREDETAHSETISEGMKEHLSNYTVQQKEPIQKVKCILDMLKEPNIGQQLQNSHSQKNTEGPKEFYAYEDQENESNKAPELLVRCVHVINDFSESGQEQQEDEGKKNPSAVIEEMNPSAVIEEMNPSAVIDEIFD